jgi:hypothetical protein
MKPILVSAMAGSANVTDIVSAAPIEKATPLLAPFPNSQFLVIATSWFGAATGKALPWQSGPQNATQIGTHEAGNAVPAT